MNVTQIGLGRTGLPQALVIADSNNTVYGIDTNRYLIERLRSGIVPFEEPSMEQLLEKLLGKKFFPLYPEQMEEAISGSDYVTVSIGVEFEDGFTSCNLENLYSISSVFRSSYKQARTLILKSTLPIGTTDNVKQLIESECGMKESQDFYLAYVPERLIEGNALHEEKSLPKLIGAYSDEGFQRAARLYQTIGGKIIRLPSPKAAEAAKLVDNSFRSTLFAYANDLALVCQSQGLDTSEIIRACNEDYPRNFIPVPGPASGYCLSKDPYILDFSFRQIAKERNFDSLWAWGARANEYVVKHMVKSISNLLNCQSQRASTNTLILGLSFKENIDDFRSSHASQIIRELIQVIPSVTIDVYDPNIGRNTYTMLPDDINAAVRHRYTELDAKIFSGMDIVIIADRHQELLLKASAREIRTLIQDTRTPLVICDYWNIWREAVNLNGVIYNGLGYGGDKQC